MPNPVPMELIDHFLDLIDAEGSTADISKIIRVIQKCPDKNHDR